MLAALIEVGHNYGDTAGFSTDSSDDALQILEMVVRGHVVGVIVQVVSQTVIAHIHHQIKVISADRSFDGALSFSGTKPGCVSLNQIGVTFIAGEGDVGLVLQIVAVTPLDQIVVDLFTKLLTAI